jgi:elongation factor P
LVATQLRVGMTIIHEGGPYKVLSVNHVTPGKGRGMVQTKLKSLHTGVKKEYRFRSEDRVEKAHLQQREMEFLYNEGSEYYFMDTENYEQISLTSDDLGESVSYLSPNVRFMIEFFEGKPVGVEPPQLVELKVVDTPPHIKGATAATSQKYATMENGMVVSVPSFIETGDVIRIDTREGKYLERVR